MMELGETGIYALMAWEIGPTRVFRISSEAHGTTQVSMSTKDGTRVWEEPRTQDDQTCIDDTIDLYLSDAGISPRPRGYLWYLDVPQGWTERDVDQAPAALTGDQYPGSIRPQVAQWAAEIRDA